MSLLGNFITGADSDDKYIASIDQGTSSTRCLYFSVKTLKIVAVAQVETNQITPHPGWLEQDPAEIFKNTVRCVNEGYERLVRVVNKGKEGGKRHPVIVSIGITNQRETTVAWSRTTGKPLYNAIIWCDSRTEDLVKEFVDKHTRDPLGKAGGEGDHNFLQKYCGLPCSTYFSAFKMMWMMRNVESVKRAAATMVDGHQNDLMFGTIDTWLIYNLTNRLVYATDCTNASRTMLMNINECGGGEGGIKHFDPYLCNLFGVPLTSLPPRIYANCSRKGYGVLHCDDIVKYKGGIYEDVWGNGRVPITGCIGDQQGSLVGNLCFEKGDAKNTYGTGCFLLVNIGDKVKISSKGLLTTIGFRLFDEDQVANVSGKSGGNMRDPPRCKIMYSFEGSVANTGSCVRWMQRNLNLFNEPSEANDLAASVYKPKGKEISPKGEGELVFVPAFSGLLAPYWNPSARGLIIGLTMQTTKAHVVKAAYEAIAMQVSEIINIIEKEFSKNNNAEGKNHSFEINELHADGGLTKSTVLMQIQADLMFLPSNKGDKMRKRSVVVDTDNIEATALGAAICSGLGCGCWNESIECVRKVIRFNSREGRVKRYECKIGEKEHSHRVKLWKKGLERSYNWSKL